MTVIETSDRKSNFIVLFWTTASFPEHWSHHGALFSKTAVRIHFIDTFLVVVYNAKTWDFQLQRGEFSCRHPSQTCFRDSAGDSARH